MTIKIDANLIRRLLVGPAIAFCYLPFTHPISEDWPVLSRYLAVFFGLVVVSLNDLAAKEMRD